MKHDRRAEFRAQSNENMLDRFMKVCMNATEDCLPLKSRARKKKKLSKIPRDRYNLMRRRRRINVQLRKTRSELRRNKLKAEARNIEKKLQESYRSSREYSEGKAVGAIRNNCKYFFSYAKKFNTIKTTVGPLTDAASQIISCPS